MNISTLTHPLLLVENSDDDAFFFQRQMRKSGISQSLHHSVNGADAIIYIKNLISEGIPLPDLIFLDLKMPVMNGFEFLLWARNQDFIPTLNIIVLSGSYETRDIQEANTLGACGYLPKPIEAKDFIKLFAMTGTEAIRGRLVNGCFKPAD